MVVEERGKNERIAKGTDKERKTDIQQENV